MNTILKKLFLLAALGLVSAGCGGTKEETPTRAAADTTETHAEGEGGREEGEAVEVTLTPEQIRASGIEVDTVGTAVLTEGFTAPGRVVPGPQGAARVGTLVPGRVVRLLATEGGSVRRGAPLAEVESFEVAELKADYVQAQAQAEQARASLNRQEALAAEQLTPARNVEEARAAFRMATASVRAAQTKLSALGIAPSAASGISNPRFVVRTPIAGTITQREVTLGEYVDPSRDLFEVTAYGSSFVEAQVPSTRASGLLSGTPAEVTTADGVRFRGRVVSVSPLVEQESRTVPVRIALTSGSLRAETFVTARFEVGAGPRVLVVPEAAVERSGGEAFVYVAVPGEAGTFARTEVELGEATASGVAVTAGLSAGQQVATKGVFYLRSARQKGELAEHDH
jgi:membrane fusion protein, heavy metal efflux system